NRLYVAAVARGSGFTNGKFCDSVRGCLKSGGQMPQKSVSKSARNPVLNRGRTIVVPFSSALRLCIAIFIQPPALSNPIHHSAEPLISKSRLSIRRFGTKCFQRQSDCI